MRITFWSFFLMDTDIHEFGNKITKTKPILLYTYFHSVIFLFPNNLPTRLLEDKSCFHLCILSTRKPTKPIAAGTEYFRLSE